MDIQERALMWYHHWKSYIAASFGLGVSVQEVTGWVNLFIAVLSLALVAWRVYHDIIIPVKKRGFTAKPRNGKKKS